MVKYSCPKCLKEFDKKDSFIKHTEKKKTPCISIYQNLPKITESENKLLKFTKNLENFANFANLEEPENSENSENFENIEEKSTVHNCRYCNKSFTTIYTLKRHINERCKVKKLEDEKKENIFNNLIEKEKINNLYNMYDELKKSNDDKNNLILELKKNNEELNKKNDELNKKIEDVLKKNTGNPQNITNTTNNIQIINNNNTNIVGKINPFGKESFDKLNRKDILKIMTDTRNNGRHCFNKLIDLIHFNSNIPENQNIYMGDYNRGKFMVHDGTDWNLSQNEEFIIFQVLEHVRKLYFSKINDEEFEQKFEHDRNFRNEFNTTFKKYYDYVFDEVDDIYLSPQELQKKRNFKELMNNEVKNKLYNKKKFVMNTYEKSKNNLLM
jgi:hypothetical protein